MGQVLIMIRTSSQENSMRVVRMPTRRAVLLAMFCLSLPTLVVATWPLRLTAEHTV